MKFLWTGLLTLNVVAWCYGAPQERRRYESPAAGKDIIIQFIEWGYPGDDSTAASVTLGVKNLHATQPVRAIRLSLQAYNKKHVVLSHKGTTISQVLYTGSILPGSTRDIDFDKAFVHPEIDSLRIQSIRVEFQNGSLALPEIF